MKHTATAVLAVIAALATSAAADAASKPQTIVIKGKGDAARITRIGKLVARHGEMQLGAARAAFGKPSSIEGVSADEGSNGDPARCVARWKALGVEGVFFPDAPVAGRRRCDRRHPLQYMLISKPTFATERGMRVGTDYATVRRLYPSVPNHGDDHYDLFSAHLQFDVDDGVVSGIELYLR